MSRQKKTLLCVVGARPNFMKIAPIIKVLESEDSRLDPCLVHTGQHYDAEMKRCFFDQLGIPEPDLDLEVGSGSHAIQTAEIMRCFEPVVDRIKPAAVLVVGDVNSTIACGLVSVKKNVPLIHVEAGLRSFDRSMPEEINRILTDQISSLLFTTERTARENLLKEGIADSRIHFVGNVMIDTLMANLKKAKIIAAQLEMPFTGEAQGYGLLTLHRPANVDEPGILAGLLQVVREMSIELPLIFPVHPRTQMRIKDAGLEDILDTPRIIITRPLAYMEMLGLMSGARLVLTDSGGIQEETTALGIPCATLRKNTERPITVAAGTNTIVGTDPEQILSAVKKILCSPTKQGRIPELWDGNAASRILRILNEKL